MAEFFSQNIYFTHILPFFHEKGRKFSQIKMFVKLKVGKIKSNIEKHTGFQSQSLTFNIKGVLLSGSSLFMKAAIYLLF